MLEFCVRKGNKELLHKLLHPYLLKTRSYRNMLAKALVLALRDNHIDISSELTEVLKEMEHSSRTSVHAYESIIARLVILDKPVVLEKELKGSCDERELMLGTHSNLYSLAKLPATRVNKCNLILNKYIYKVNTIGEIERPYVTEADLRFLFAMFDDFPDIMTKEFDEVPGLIAILNGILMRDSVKAFRRRDKDIYYKNSSLLLQLMEVRHYYQKVRCKYIVRACRPVIKWLLQQDSVVDAINTKEYQPLLTVLVRFAILMREHKTLFRSNLEMLLYSNVEILSLIFEQFVWIDEALFCDGMATRFPECFMVPQKLITDAKEHPVFGYNTGDDYAMQFAVPLLLECGYTVSVETLETALNKNLHQMN